MKERVFLVLISRYRSLLRIVPHANVGNKNMGTKRGAVGGINWETDIDIYALLCINGYENLLYGSGNSNRGSVST